MSLSVSVWVLLSRESTMPHAPHGASCLTHAHGSTCTYGPLLAGPQLVDCSLSGAGRCTPPVALQGVATPPSRLFPQFRGCRRGVAATPPPPGPRCTLSRVVCNLDLRNPAATIRAGVALNFDTKILGVCP